MFYDKLKCLVKLYLDNTKNIASHKEIDRNKILEHFLKPKIKIGNSLM